LEIKNINDNRCGNSFASGPKNKKKININNKVVSGNLLDTLSVISTEESPSELCDQPYLSRRNAKKEQYGPPCPRPDKFGKEN